MPLSRSSVARTSLAALVVAASVASCASPVGKADLERCEERGFVVGSSAFFSCALETPETRSEETGGRAAAANPALRPDDPWLGTIGLRSLLAGEYEYGLGVCVPNPYSTRIGQQSFLADRGRSLGVGAWLQFDF